MTAKIITSPSNPLIKDIKALEMRKRRKETGLFMAEGLRTLIEGIELGADLRYFVYLDDMKDRPDIVRVRDYCAAQSGESLEVSQNILEKLSHKDNPQSVIGVFRQKFLPLEQVFPQASKCWVVLEQIRDPGNLGTIIRTVDSVGADGVILVDNCCDPYSVEAVRATMGSIFHVPIVVTSLTDFTNWAGNWTGSIVGTTLQSSVDFREVVYTSPLLLVMGNEQAGLSEEMRGVCHQNVRLPMNGRADSLNLSIATGVMLYAMLEPWDGLKVSLP
jgi:TrmH family RNA methyltransferase